MTEVERLKPAGEALIKEIVEAFKSVRREGGVSWSEADVIDDYGSMKERLAARAKDKEHSWQDLINDTNWYPQIGGRYSFLDPTGFRYYLPPAMIRAIRLGVDQGIQFHLTAPAVGNEFRDFATGKWSRFDETQLRCVAKFLRYMTELCEAHGKDNPENESACKFEASNWREALESNWFKLL